MAKAHGSPEIGTGAGEGLVRRHPDLTEAARDPPSTPRHDGRGISGGGATCITAWSAAACTTIRSMPISPRLPAARPPRRHGHPSESCQRKTRARPCVARRKPSCARVAGASLSRVSRSRGRGRHGAPWRLRRAAQRSAATAAVRPRCSRCTARVQACRPH